MPTNQQDWFSWVVQKMNLKAISLHEFLNSFSNVSVNGIGRHSPSCQQAGPNLDTLTFREATERERVSPIETVVVQSPD